MGLKSKFCLDYRMLISSIPVNLSILFLRWKKIKMHACQITSFNASFIIPIQEQD
jgi:hypothetical protein